MSSILDLLGQFGRLGETIDKFNSKVEPVMNYWEKLAKTVGMTAEELDNNLNEFKSLSVELDTINKDVEKHEKDYKELEAKRDKRDINEKKYFDQLEKERDKQQKMQKEYNENLKKFGGKSPNEIKSLLQQKEQKDVNLREAQKNEGNMNKALGKLKGNPWLMVADMALKAIEWGIGKITEYIKLGYENEMRAMQAITTSNVNTMRANLSLWQNAMSGAYEAQNLAMSSNLAMIEAENATELANTKFRNSLLKWIPFYGSVLGMQETEMEMEQKMQELRIKNATETIQTAEGLAKQLDEYLYKQDAAIYNYARSVGLSINQTEQFEHRMISLNKGLSEFGRTAEDVLKIQSSTQEQSGRLINYSDADYERIGAIGKIMGDENVAKMNAEMVLFNQSVSSSASIMEDMYKYANKMGLSQKKLTQNVLSNLKMAEKYQFKGGVQGYIQLAKIAENLRFDLSQLGGVIEKIQSGGLESVIKQSAQLQVLGGGFAMNADPFRLAYNAFQNPQGLVEEMANMVKGMGTFDSKTGQLEFGSGDLMRIRAGAQTLGVSQEQLLNMSRELDKKARVSAALGRTNLDQEQKDAIANSAQWDAKKQEWYVNTIHGGRKSMNQLSSNPNLINDILSNDANEQLVDYAKGTLSATERTAQATQYISALLGAAGLDMFNDTVNETAQASKDGAEKNKDEMVDIIGQVYQHSIQTAKESAQGWAGMAKKVAEAYDIQKDAATSAKEVEELLKEQYNKAYERLQKRKEDNRAREARQSLTKEQIQKVESNPNQTTNDKFNILESKRKIVNQEMTSATDASTGWSKLKEGMALALKKRALEKKTGRTQAYKAESDDVVDQVLGLDNKEATAEPIQDAFATAGEAPMAVAAKSVTPINDGLALADKRDTAVFAKTGGPFDKLFNGIFDRINAVYDAFGIDRGTRLGRMTPLPFNPIKEMPKEMGIEQLAPRGQGGNNEAIKFEPLKIEMNGRLELSNGGKSVDIMNELQNNPLLVREIAKMLSDSLSSKFYGGKSRYNAGQNTYFR